MDQETTADSTWKDPIVEEVRLAREGLFPACEHDLARFVARLRESERERGMPSVSYPKRKPSAESAQ